MSQNLATTHFDAPQWEVVDQAIGAVEVALAPLVIPLEPETRRRMVKMGDASEPFCRKAHNAMRDNEALLPRSLDVEEMGRDMATHDALAIRIARLARLMEKLADTDMALGSDVMSAALEGYAFLKISGRGEGLDGLRRELGRRFEKSGTRKPEPATA